MTITLASFVVGGALLASLCCASGVRQKEFVCHMNVLTSTERKDMAEIIDRLLSKAHSGRELTNGYEIRFPDSGMFADASKWASYEHRCCGFFDISLSLTRNSGPLVIRITGAKGAKEFLAADLPKLKKLVTGTPNTR